ncbi:MAG: TetR/AcrR family transcriptional regulator, partial [Acidimicrobiales bacterium]
MARDLDASRAAILDVAESVFAERGFDGTSMQDIATAAGVSRGMPGYAFGSKASLYEAVLDRAFAR